MKNKWIKLGKYQTKFKVGVNNKAISQKQSEHKIKAN